MASIWAKFNAEGCGRLLIQRVFNGKFNMACCREVSMMEERPKSTGGVGAFQTDVLEI
jgi:hypothetical protein